MRGGTTSTSVHGGLRARAISWDSSFMHTSSSRAPALSWSTCCDTLGFTNSASHGFGPPWNPSLRLRQRPHLLPQLIDRQPESVGDDFYRIKCGIRLPALQATQIG